jgi:hypothetical protein
VSGHILGGKIESALIALHRGTVVAVRSIRIAKVF